MHARKPTLIKGVIQWISVHSKAVHQSLFSITQKKPVSSYSPPLPQPLGIPNLLSRSTDLPTLDISYKWNHMICGPLCLAYFTEHPLSRIVHGAACVRTSFHCVDGPRLVVHLSADGHLGCLYSLSIMNRLVRAVGICLRVDICFCPSGVNVQQSGVTGP